MDTPPVDPWSRPRAPMEYGEPEPRTFEGMELILRRRPMTFLETERALALCLDHETKRPNLLVLLEDMVRVKAVVAVNFDLTPERVRSLQHDPGLGMFLANWVCSDTVRLLSIGAKGDAEKKSGTPLRGVPGTRTPRKSSRASRSRASESPSTVTTPSPAERSS